jgi:competence protein ComEA
LFQPDITVMRAAKALQSTLKELRMIRTFFIALLAALSLNAFAVVDANQASQAELETVKGIGPGLSGKILEARKTGAFKDWGDMVERVPGVGPGNAARFSQAGLTVAGTAYNGSAVAPKPPKEAKAPKSAKAEKALKPQ